MKRQQGRTTGAMIGVLVDIGFFSAWLTHVVDCSQQHAWGFLIAGAIVFPVGIVHGVGVWFGFWA